MHELNPLGWWRRLRALPEGNRTKTLIIASLVALVSSAVVPVTAIMLTLAQRTDLQRERPEQMEAVIVAPSGLAEIVRESGATSLETRLVDLQTGSFATGIDPANYDQRAAASDPALSIALPREIDIAGIGRRSNFAPVHILRRGREVAAVVLPVNGRGYQSIIHAYLALNGDLKTVAALAILEQDETPGIGSRIEDPEWLELWRGRDLADESGTIRISVVRQASAPYEVDGISGATRTTTGITNMLHFWLGDHGFGPFLAGLRSGRVSP